MKIRDIVTFVFLAAGIVGVLGGIGAVSRDIHLGWASIGVGLVLTFASYRAMKRTVDSEIEGPTEIDIGTSRDR